MSKYQTRMTELEDQINKQAALRNAQASDSENHAHFQKKINDLTADLRRLEGAIPQLEKLDEQVEQAQQHVYLAARDFHDDGTLPRSALWCGGLGLPLTLLSLVWTPTVFLPIVGVALVVAAGFFLVRSMRTRRVASEYLDDAHQELAGLQQKRKNLLQSLTAPENTLPLVEVPALSQADHDVKELAI